MKKIKPYNEERQIPFQIKLLRVMKITCILLMIALIQVTASTYSQSTKLTLDMKNVTLSELLDKIEQDSEFRFFYDSDGIDRSALVSLSATDTNIEDILNDLFRGSDVGYEIFDRYIILKNIGGKAAEGKIFMLQQKTISGKVTDSGGEPLPGVTVLVKGTTKGTLTDSNGKFSLSDIPADAILQFSFVGMETQEITIGTLTQINVILLESAIGLDEVVVIGYGTMKKKDLTGAIGVVNVKELPKSVNTSVTQMLSGKVAGVQIQSIDAQPGGGVNILIRGQGSLQAGNDPLIIIDGFPLNNNDLDPDVIDRYSTGSRDKLNTINPNDIESIEVLKDVSAAAIYGARAANGVILITTKSGKKGDATINYDFKQSFQKIYKDWDMMNASEYMTAFNAYKKEVWKMDNKIYPYGNTDPITIDPFSPFYSIEQIAQAGIGTDWLNEVTRLGEIQEHNLSVSGGNNKINYLTSFNSFDQKGIVKKNEFNRITGRLNLDAEVHDWIKVGIRATGSSVNYDNPSLTPNAQSDYTDSQQAGVEYRGTGNAGIITSAITFLPIYPVKDENGDYSQNINDPNMPNPVSLLEISNSTSQYRLLAQSYLEIEPLTNLKIRTQLGFDNVRATTSFYMPKTVVHGAIRNGQARINQNNELDKLFNTTVSYNKAIGSHNISGLLGYEFQEFEEQGHYLEGEEYPSDAFLYNTIGSGNVEKQRVGSHKYIDKLVSYFGRINYNIKDKYLLTLSLRADGSTKFGKGNKYGYFPSGAFAWRIINESFIKGINWISDLKLRLSAGQTGNSNISGAFALYGFGHNYQFGNKQLPGSYLDSYANDNLKWETTTEYNWGLDFGFINNRINGSVELYYKEISDLLGTRSLPSYLALNTVADNVGVVKSNGYEITLNTLNIDRVIKWRTTMNFSSYRDRWKERNPDVILSSYESENDPLRVYWGYELDGLVQPDEIVPHMPGAYPGVQKVKDINGYDENNKLTGQPDGIINDADVVKIANQDPDFIFGFTNNLEFKNFDLNVHMYGMIGIRSSNPYLGINDNIYLDRWNSPKILLEGKWWSSENLGAKYPNNNIANPYPGAYQYILEKADFLRVKNITLGYNLPNMGKLASYFKNARIYIDISNPLTITGYKGIDPEYDKGSAQYPAQRTYTLGINIVF